MPSLKELVQFLSLLPAAKNLRLNLELKSLPAGDGILHPKPKSFAQLVWKNIKALGIERNVVVQSFDHRLIAELKKLSPKLPLSLLFADNSVDYALVATKMKVKEVSVNQYWLSEASARELRRKKIRIRVWTANEERDWERLAKLKVNSIITDYPGELRAFLRRKRLHA
jgi:glycerophosphoryl diester phosphodiesterase